MDEPNIFHLLTNWPIEPPSTLTPLEGGTNNRTWLVQTAGAAPYVLRLRSGTIDLPRIRYEAALLNTLRKKPLPFHLPHPLPASNGEHFVLVTQDHLTPLIATLTPFLPGTIPERTAINIAKAGVALAQLDAALATIPATALPTHSGSTRFLYGDLYHCHPLVPDPIATVAEILSPAQAQPLCAILRQTQQDWEMLSLQNVPQQILHRDCGPGNVLMAEERVTAILDFEFADTDRRLFDLCVAISWWPVRLMGTGQEWELIDAFGQAYTKLFPLTAEELRHLPSALRMRDTTSLIYRIGRYLAGLESKQTIQERVEHSLWREAWLMAHHETLLSHALAWKMC
ncbi:MAG: phosphotransferase [Ktedonobacteraceae bacterium]